MQIKLLLYKMSPGYALSTIYKPTMSNNIVSQKDNNLVKTFNYLINKSLQIGSATIKLLENRPKSSSG